MTSTCTSERPPSVRHDRIRDALRYGGAPLFIDSPTNQVFPIVADKDLAQLGSAFEYGFWEKRDDGHTTIRLATSWATIDEDVTTLLDALSHWMAEPARS